MNKITENILKGCLSIDNITYSDFIKDRKIYSSYYKAQKEGLESHHLVSIRKQILLWNKEKNDNIKTRREFIKKVPFHDDRCVRLTPFEHIIAHYLMAKEDINEAFIFSNMIRFNFKKLKDMEEIDKISKLKELSRLRERARSINKEIISKRTFYEKRKIVEKGLKTRKENNNWYPTEETRKKMSESNKGRIVSEETKKKISEAQIGKIIPQDVRNKISNKLKGRKVPEEVKLKISNTLKGRPIPEEQKIKISQTEKGKIVSEETREKQRLAKLGKPSLRKGQKATEETKQKVSKGVKESLNKESFLYKKLKENPNWNKSWQEFRHELKQGTYDYLLNK